MERAGRLLQKLKNTSVGFSSEDLLRNAWPVAVGKKIAARTLVSNVFDRTLVVDVEDAMWQKQLGALNGQIMRNLEKIVGELPVDTIRYRVALPRRSPQREEELPVQSGVVDEADGIQDPLLRRIYIAARKREIA